MHTSGDITCGEIGSAEGERWSAPFVATLAERAAIKALEGKKILQACVAAGGLRVAGLDQVGTVVLPGGRRICIRPKVDDLVLLDWLAYVGNIPPVTQWARRGDLGARGIFPSLLAESLLAELEAVTRRSLREGFTQVRCDFGAVRGRVLAGELGRRAHRLPNVPHAYRARTVDTPHNRLLAAALDRVEGLLERSAVGLRQRWLLLREEWAEVPRPVEVAAALADARCACPRGYENAVALAGALLHGCTAQQAGGAPGGTFLISLSSVWERALRRMCREIQNATGWVPVPDAERTRRWHDGAGLSSPIRWMTADVLLARGGRRWVLDAKYKRDFGCEDRNDRFQATAYALAFDAGRGTLVYPTADGTCARCRLLLAGTVSKNRVTIDSIELPMAAGPEVCRGAVLDVMRQNERAPHGHRPSPQPTLFDYL